MADRPVRRTKRRAENGGSTSSKVRKVIGEGPTYGRRTIAIKVRQTQDDEKETFDVHKDLLATHLELFRAAMAENDWNERQDELLILDETSVDVFEVFKQFLYTGTIYCAQDPDDTEAGNEGALRHDDPELTRIKQCWELGEKLMSITFKDAVTDALIVKVNSEVWHPLNLHESIYPASLQTSSIRKLLVDITIWDWNDNTFDDWEKFEDAGEFCFDVAKALHKRRREDVGDRTAASFVKGDNCVYHEHVAAGTPCYKTMVWN